MLGGVGGRGGGGERSCEAKGSRSFIDKFIMRAIRVRVKKAIRQKETGRCDRIVTCD